MLSAGESTDGRLGRNVPQASDVYVQAAPVENLPATTTSITAGALLPLIAPLVIRAATLPALLQIVHGAGVSSQQTCASPAHQHQATLAAQQPSLASQHGLVLVV